MEKFLESTVLLGSKYYPRSISVKPMHKCRPGICLSWLPVLLEMINERIDERSGPLFLGWMREHRWRLVNCDDIVVFKQDLKRDRLGFQLTVTVFIHLCRDFVACPQTP